MNSLTLVLGLVIIGIILILLLIRVRRNRSSHTNDSIERLSELIQRGEDFSIRDYGEDTARLPGDITTDAPPPAGDVKKKRKGK